MSWLRTAAATDTGYLRVTNQDVALATNDLAAVADGMGGHLGGEVAARIAVEQLLEAYRRDRTTDGLLAAVAAANSAVYARSKSDRNLRGMGTTLTAAAFIGDEPDGQLRVALVNVGDSRAYLVDWRERRVHKLTEDHSVVEEMVRSGELTLEEAAVHPHRHILTRALGIEPSIEPDCWELDLEPGSRLLLCSDGLTNELGEQDIAKVLLDEADAEKAASELVRLALHRGGIDNVTVVVRGAVAIIGLTSAVPTGPLMATGRLGRKQLAALAALLDETSARGLARVILIHHPPLSRGEPPFRGLTDAAAFERIIGEHGAEAILHGHTHKQLLRSLPSRATRTLGGKVPVLGAPSAAAAAHDPRTRAAYHLVRLELEGGLWRVSARVRGLALGGEQIGEREALAV